jgi:Domain of unknown function (DUF4082)
MTITIPIIAADGAQQPISIFKTQTPALVNQSDGPSAPYELGLKFQSSVTGKITGIRFWKGSAEQTRHVGRIWSASGTLLASVTFANETASGWQVQNLATPLSINAHTTYVVSVSTSNTNYVCTNNVLSSAIINGPLSTVVGNNGVYGPRGTFPTQTWQASNYFRDVVFVPAPIPQVTPTTFSSASGYGLNELVGVVSATNNPTSFQISGDPNNYFTIDNTGALRTSAVVAVPQPATYSINVAATNAKGQGDFVTILIVDGTPISPAAGILPADRAVIWNPGMMSVGGIPNRTTIFRTLSPSGGEDSTLIQAAIDACPVGQVVQLTAGTFNFSGGRHLLINKGITLRGAGAGKTILAKTDGAVLNTTASGPRPSPIIIVGPAQFGLSTIGSTNLTADAVAGSKSLQVASRSGLSVGQFVLLDEVSGAGWQPDVTGTATSIWASPDYRVTWRKRNPNTPGDDFGTNSYPYQSGTNGDQYSRLDRPINEIKEIASISGNTVTFTSPVTISYRVNKTAQLTRFGVFPNYVPHVKNAGIEALSTQGGDDNAVQFNMCAYCWIKGFENSIWSGRGVAFLSSFRCELRDFYSHDAAFSRPGGGAYAIAFDWGSSEILVENGISIRANKVMVARAAGTGSVVGYCYTDMGFIDYSEGWIEIGLNASHFVGPHHVLFEGNYGVNGDSDNTHGSSIYHTFFRNHLRGIRGSFLNPLTGHTVNDATQGGSPSRMAGPMSYSYWFSFIGNVLGASGKMGGWKYEGTWTTGAAIWMLGWGDSNPDPQVADPTFPGHIIRDGNWDFLTNSQRWHDTPGKFTIPASLYLSSKPAFFGSNPWPWVDPATGATYLLPAKARFEAGTPNG